MNRTPIVAKGFLLIWLFGVVACTSLPLERTDDRSTELSVEKARNVLNRQLSQPYSIYKHKRRFRSDSDRHQLIRAQYIEQLKADSLNGFIRYTESNDRHFDYVEVTAPEYMPSIPVYALNRLGFAYPDGERVIHKITSIDDDIVSFQLGLIPGPLLKSRGFTDSSKVYSGRAKLEYNVAKHEYEIIVFEQISSAKNQWRKLGFEVERLGQKTVFFIDPDTELLFEFLEKHNPESNKYKAMLPFKKYIKPIQIRKH